MRLAISISPSRVSSATDVILRRYERTGSLVEEYASSASSSASSALAGAASSSSSASSPGSASRFAAPFDVEPPFVEDSTISMSSFANADSQSSSRADEPLLPSAEALISS